MKRGASKNAAPVRRAIVAASRATHRTRAPRRAHARLRRLDPDADVREAARLALAGDGGELPVPMVQLGAGCAGRSLSLGTCQVAWIALSPTSAAPSGQLQGDIAGRSGSYHDPTGLVLPVVSDPDGALLLPGVSRGPASFRLASSSSWDEAPHDDAKEIRAGKRRAAMRPRGSYSKTQSDGSGISSSSSSAAISRSRRHSGYSKRGCGWRGPLSNGSIAPSAAWKSCSVSTPTVSR